MKTPDQELIQRILKEIDAHLTRGVLPVHNGHLQAVLKEAEVLDYLVFMKKEGLISGDLITKGAGNTPYRMTNIRLTYVGIRVLHS